MQTLISKKIFLRFYKSTDTDVVVSFFRTAHQFASGPELRSTLKWLIQGNYYFRKYCQFWKEDLADTNAYQTYDIDIRDLSVSSRNYTLQVVQDIAQPCSIRISVYASDSTNPKSILDFLPRTISHLDISVQESIEPSLIPALIRSLPALKSFGVNIYGRPLRSLLPTSQINIIPSVTCTYASFSIPWDPEDDERCQFSHEFLFLRGEEVHWRNKGWDVREFPHGKLPEDIGSDTIELQAEVASWFNQNESIKSIEFKMWAAYPWAFYFNEAEIPEGDDINWYDAEFESSGEVETDDDLQ
jgi:hypothetical protein